MSMFTLTISCLTTPNLPWFIYLTFKVPMQYYHLLYTIRLYFHHKHIHNWESFLLWPSHFFLSEAIGNNPLLFPSSISDTFWPEGLIFQWCHTIILFHTDHGALQARILEWVAICLGGPYTACLKASLNYTSPFAMTRLSSMKGRSNDYPVAINHCSTQIMILNIISD